MQTGGLEWTQEGLSTIYLFSIQITAQSKEFICNYQLFFLKRNGDYVFFDAFHFTVEVWSLSLVLCGVDLFKLLLKIGCVDLFRSCAGENFCWENLSRTRHMISQDNVKMSVLKTTFPSSFAFIFFSSFTFISIPWLRNSTHNINSGLCWKLGGEQGVSWGIMMHEMCEMLQEWSLSQIPRWNVQDFLFGILFLKRSLWNSYMPQT